MQLQYHMIFINTYFPQITQSLLENRSNQTDKVLEKYQSAFGYKNPQLCTFNVSPFKPLFKKKMQRVWPKWGCPLTVSDQENRALVKEAT